MALTLHGTVSDNTVALDRKTATPLIINGDMAIDQRNSGASLTITGNDVSCDRWKFQVSQASKLTSEQNDSSGLANFNNYMRITTASAYTPATDEFFIVKQNIEGQNMTFLNFGSSDAQAITLGFYVRSSLTGTFGGAVYNQAGNRNHPFSYTISSANTWEFKTVNISGDTTGTWQKDNAIGMTLLFSLGANATRLNTAGTWTATYSTGATGQVNMIETGSATWDVTGVQLEVGTFDANSIPPFQFEDRGTSLARCQRYCYQEDNFDTYHNQVNGFYANTTLFVGLVALPVALRSTPTLVTSGSYVCAGVSSLSASSLIIVDSAGTDLTKIQVRATVSGATAGQGTVLRNNNDASAIFRLESEL